MNREAERKRLVELIKDSLIKHIGKSCLLAENIASDLLDNGIVVPPVKAGQTVYCIVEGFDVVMEGHVRQLIVAEGIFIDCVIRGYFNQVFHVSNIGKTVFTSREDAVKALEGEEK